MLGWGFIVYRQKNNQETPVQKEISDFAKEDFGDNIAKWDADIKGLNWIKNLIDDQKAICLIPAGYPGFYTSQAKYVLPILQDRPPFVLEYWKWIDDEYETYPIFNKVESAILSCHSDEWLVIEVWDLS